MSKKAAGRDLTQEEINNILSKNNNKTIGRLATDEDIKFIEGDLKDKELLKSLGRVDIVTVNPPYKIYNSGILNESDKSAIARHEVCCNLEDVIIGARTLLKDNGKLFMVHRPDRIVDIFTLMRKYKIEPKRIRFVHPKPGKAPNILLVEGQRDGGAFLKIEDPLYVHMEDDSYSEEVTGMYNSQWLD